MKTPEQRWEEFNQEHTVSQCITPFPWKNRFIHQIREAEDDAREAEHLRMAAKLVEKDQIELGVLMKIRDDARKDENEACAKIAEDQTAACMCSTCIGKRNVAWLIRNRITPPKPKSPFGCECWQPDSIWGWVRYVADSYQDNAKVAINSTSKVCDQCGAKRIAQ